MDEEAQAGEVCESNTLKESEAKNDQDSEAKENIFEVEGGYISPCSAVIFDLLVHFFCVFVEQLLRASFITTVNNNADADLESKAAIGTDDIDALGHGVDSHTNEEIPPNAEIDAPTDDVVNENGVSEDTGFDIAGDASIPDGWQIAEDQQDGDGVGDIGVDEDTGLAPDDDLTTDNLPLETDGDNDETEAASGKIDEQDTQEDNLAEVDSIDDLNVDPNANEPTAGDDIALEEAHDDAAEGEESAAEGADPATTENNNNEVEEDVGTDAVTTDGPSKSDEATVEDAEEISATLLAEDDAEINAVDTTMDDDDTVADSLALGETVEEDADAHVGDDESVAAEDFAAADDEEDGIAAGTDSITDTMEVVEHDSHSELNAQIETSAIPEAEVATEPEDAISEAVINEQIAEIEADVSLADVADTTSMLDGMQNVDDMGNGLKQDGFEAGDQTEAVDPDENEKASNDLEEDDLDETVHGSEEAAEIVTSDGGQIVPGEEIAGETGDKVSNTDVEGEEGDTVTELQAQVEDNNEDDAEKTLDLDGDKTDVAALENITDFDENNSAENLELDASEGQGDGDSETPSLEADISTTGDAMVIDKERTVIGDQQAEVDLEDFEDAEVNDENDATIMISDGNHDGDDGVAEDDVDIADTITAGGKVADASTSNMLTEEVDEPEFDVENNATDALSVEVDGVAESELDLGDATHALDIDLDGTDAENVVDTESLDNAEAEDVNVETDKVKAGPEDGSEMLVIEEEVEEENAVEISDIHETEPDEAAALQEDVVDEADDEFNKAAAEPEEGAIDDSTLDRTVGIDEVAAGDINTAIDSEPVDDAEAVGADDAEAVDVDNVEAVDADDAKAEGVGDAELEDVDTAEAEDVADAEAEDVSDAEADKTLAETEDEAADGSEMLVIEEDELEQENAPEIPDTGDADKADAHDETLVTGADGDLDDVADISAVEKLEDSEVVIADDLSDHENATDVNSAKETDADTENAKTEGTQSADDVLAETSGAVDASKSHAESQDANGMLVIEDDELEQETALEISHTDYADKADADGVGEGDDLDETTEAYTVETTEAAETEPELGDATDAHDVGIVATEAANDIDAEDASEGLENNDASATDVAASDDRADATVKLTKDDVNGDDQIFGTHEEDDGEHGGEGFAPDNELTNAPSMPEAVEPNAGGKGTNDDDVEQATDAEAYVYNDDGDVPDDEDGDKNLGFDDAVDDEQDDDEHGVEGGKLVGVDGIDVDVDIDDDDVKVRVPVDDSLVQETHEELVVPLAPEKNTVNISGPGGSEGVEDEQAEENVLQIARTRSESSSKPSTVRSAVKRRRSDSLHSEIEANDAKRTKSAQVVANGSANSTQSTAVVADTKVTFKHPVSTIVNQRITNHADTPVTSSQQTQKILTSTSTSKKIRGPASLAIRKSTITAVQPASETPSSTGTDVSTTVLDATTTSEPVLLDAPAASNSSVQSISLEVQSSDRSTSSQTPAAATEMDVPACRPRPSPSNSSGSEPSTPVSLPPLLSTITLSPRLAKQRLSPQNLRSNKVISPVVRSPVSPASVSRATTPDTAHKPSTIQDKPQHSTTRTPRTPRLRIRPRKPVAGGSTAKIKEKGGNWRTINLSPMPSFGMGGFASRPRRTSNFLDMNGENMVSCVMNAGMV